MLRSLKLVRHLGIFAILVMVFAPPSVAQDTQCGDECSDVIATACVEMCPDDAYDSCGNEGIPAACAGCNYGPECTELECTDPYEGWTWMECKKGAGSGGGGEH